MLKRTLSAITAVVIGTSGLGADAVDKSVSVSISDAGAKKGVIVVENNPVVSTQTNQPTQTNSSITTNTTTNYDPC